MSLRVFKLLKHCNQLRQIHQSSVMCFFDSFHKPVARAEDMAVGFEKIMNDAAEEGEDPLEVCRETVTAIKGDGSRKNPFIVPSRETKRFVLVEIPGGHGGAPIGFWVTAEEGGRCPLTARYFKLEPNPCEQWGTRINQLDLFMH